ncbi:N-acetyltransferase family protein [Tsuneonella sp. HG094]
MSHAFAVRRLRPGDGDAFRAMNRLYAEAFEDAATYLAAPPGQDWIDQLLAHEGTALFVASAEGEIVGALTAYEFMKPESERRELYIYDLAVADQWRRRGVATALIDAVRALARSRGGWVIFVQADYTDPPAIALYQKLGTREEVLHFDIEP